MTHTGPTRRDFLQWTGASASAGLLGTAPAGQKGAGPAATDACRTVYTRRNIASLSPNGPEVAALRQGVKVMKSRPATNTTSWLYQANIHGTYDTPVRPD